MQEFKERCDREMVASVAADVESDDDDAEDAKCKIVSVLTCVQCFRLIPKQSAKLHMSKSYCFACFNNNPDIAADQKWRNYVVNYILWSKRQTVCQMCHMIVLDSPNDMENKFELDHITPQGKKDSVRDLCKKGAALEAIALELQKCRVLCHTCHATVTAVQQKSGVLLCVSGLRKNQGVATPQVCQLLEDCRVSIDQIAEHLLQLPPRPRICWPRSETVSILGKRHLE